jgi:RNA polymerase sigma factor (sigma-70 family)
MDLKQFFEQQGKPIEDEAHEALLILDAQEGLDEPAQRLLLAYLPLLKKQIGVFARQGHDVDELRSCVVWAFHEAIDAFDVEKSSRLASTLPVHVSRALLAEFTTERQQRGPSIPLRTAQRYQAVLAEAGDSEVSDALLLKHHMTREAFVSVREALVTDHDNVHDLVEAGAAGLPGQVDVAFASVEQQMMVAQALQSLTDLARSVCQLAYGFESFGDPMSDYEIADALGISRDRVRRIRIHSLEVMRLALGA